MSGKYSTMQFWAGNPTNRRSDYEGGIATLLFEQCPKFCVETDMPGADLTSGEALCIKNC